MALPRMRHAHHRPVTDRPATPGGASNTARRRRPKGARDMDARCAGGIPIDRNGFAANHCVSCRPGRLRLKDHSGTRRMSTPPRNAPCGGGASSYDMRRYHR